MSDADSFAEPVATAALIVTCGPGGVGKTTTAAALGVAAARAGRRVVVVTVDPARRLADALGLEAGAAADQPHLVTNVAMDGDGELWALMLDAASTFDRLVREQTTSAKQAEAILQNPVYRAISGSLAGAQEYMAIERLHQLHTSGEWDLVIVDTPPSRHAIDLLEAPDRLINFLGHPVYRTLTAGQRAFARVTNAAASMFLWAVRRLAGPQIVEDTVEFFRSLANIEPGLRRRAEEVSELLRSDSATFVVVSSPRAEAIGEAEHLIGALRDGDFPFAGVVVNLIHPMPEQLAPADRAALADLDDGPLADHVAWHDELTALATAERNELAALADLAEDVAVVELALMPVDVHDVDGLVGLADQLTGSA
ncbi:MAG TPA: ArsA-related P-loop ATPase [Ilumatobacteraceae bacterium]|jgi:anion-transporting  ArsA/GET3 family ATPase|nr:ArsA-related P-loop ATPase [Ilumatobacteraceae bacterium]